MNTKANKEYLTNTNGKYCLRDDLILFELSQKNSKYLIAKKYNLGSKVINNTWKRAKELDSTLAKQCSSEAYRRVTIGNKRGLRPPSIIIDKEKLLEAINTSTFTIEAIKKLNITEFLFNRNLKYYNIESTKLIKAGNKDQLSMPFFENLQKFDLYLAQDFQRLMDNPLEASKRLHKIFLEYTQKCDIIQKLGRTLAKKINHKIVYTKNTGIRKIAELLYQNSIDFEQEKMVEKYFYDFYIPIFNLLVEVDGSVHRKGKNILKIRRNDRIKDKVANRNNFELMRVVWTGKILKYEQLHKLIQDKINKKDREAENI